MSSNVIENYKNVLFMKEILEIDLKKVIYLSIDLGNGYTKISVQLDGKILRFIEPSMILEKKYVDSIENFSVGEVLNYYSSKVGGVEFVVGVDVGDNEKGINLYGESNRINENYVIHLIGMIEKYIGIEKLKTHSLILAMGTPDVEINSKTRTMMEQAVLNLKQGVKNGVPFDINIVALEINEQSNSAFGSLLFDDNLQVQNREYLDGEYVKLDLGFGTGDGGKIKDGKILSQYNFTTALGMVEVIKEIQSYIQKEYGVEVSFNKIHENFSEGFVKINKTKTFDYSDFKDSALKSLALKIKSRLTTQFGRLDLLDGILLFGGTAIIMYPYLKEELKDVDVELILSPNPQFAIADGQLKRAINNKSRIIEYQLANKKKD